MITFLGCAPEPEATAPPASADTAETAASVEEHTETGAAPPPELVETQAAALQDGGPATEEVQAAALQEEGSEVIPREPDRNRGPQGRTVFYRADASQPASIPKVMLSKGHEALCSVKVGDTLPAIELERIGGGRRRLAELFGRQATVVVFWRSDRHMARQQLADLGPDVMEPFGDSGMAVVGIAVDEPAEAAQSALQNAGADFPNLLDAGGKAFAQVGSEKLPRTYLVDPQGKILWFDVEYSLATRRELHQALRAVAGGQ